MSAPRKLPSGLWQIRWIDGDGVRKSATFPTFKLAESELRLRQVQASEDRARRERNDEGTRTVLDAGERFFAGRKRPDHMTERRFESRGRRHRINFDHHIAPHIGERRLCDLTPRVLREWLELLSSKPTGRPGEKNATGRTLSAGTIRSIVCTLNQLAKANDVKLEIILAEPLRQKKRRSRPRALQSLADVRALLAECRDPWFRVAAALACYCGARLGEIASLRWRHIGEASILIEMSWDGPVKNSQDEDEGSRVVPLHPELAAILEAWRTVTNGGPDDHVVLFQGKRPLRERADDVAAKTRNACRRAKLADVSFHGLRASYATICADQGLPVSKLAALLGHADIATTGIYVRSTAAVAALDPRALLGGSVVATAAATDDSLLN